MDERTRLINAIAELQRGRSAVEPTDLGLLFQLDTQLDAARSLLGKLNDLDHITDEWNLQAERVMDEIEREIPESVIDTRSFSGAGPA